jgi:hypothetical protein
MERASCRCHRKSLRGLRKRSVAYGGHTLTEAEKLGLSAEPDLVTYSMTCR